MYQLIWFLVLTSTLFDNVAGQALSDAGKEESRQKRADDISIVNLLKAQGDRLAAFESNVLQRLSQFSIQLKIQQSQSNNAINGLKTEVNAKLAEIGKELTDNKKEMNGKFTGLEKRLEAVGDELNAKMDNVSTDMNEANTLSYKKLTETSFTLTDLHRLTKDNCGKSTGQQGNNNALQKECDQTNAMLENATKSVAVSFQNVNKQLGNIFQKVDEVNKIVKQNSDCTELGNSMKTGNEQMSAILTNISRRLEGGATSELHASVSDMNRTVHRELEFIQRYMKQSSQGIVDNFITFNDTIEDLRNVGDSKLSQLHLHVTEVGRKAEDRLAQFAIQLTNASQEVGAKLAKIGEDSEKFSATLKSAASVIIESVTNDTADISRKTSAMLHDIDQKVRNLPGDLDRTSKDALKQLTGGQKMIETSVGQMGKTINSALSSIDHKLSEEKQTIENATATSRDYYQELVDKIGYNSKSFYHLMTAIFCPKQYHYVNHSCYKIGESEKDWKTADSICKAEGAGLVAIGTDTEAQAVHTVVKATYKHTGKPLWVGAAPPRAKVTQTNCTALKTGTNQPQWTSLSCDQANYFICEI